MRSEAAAYRFMNFYSRPCGRATRDLHSVLACAAISTHAPAGGDPAECYVSGAVHVFLLTPLREGRHHSVNLLWCLVTFLLTPLREGRLMVGFPLASAFYFYSRPCGRGDAPAAEIPRKLLISTHAPAGGRPKGGKLMQDCCHFYSRPCGGATSVGARVYVDIRFLLTPLREGRLIRWSLSRLR